ncbi:MAG: DUF512 domain-containing protein [Wujia sp.]
MKKHLIDTIEEGSIAWELDIEKGDYLVSINGKEIQDIFDYHYLLNEEYLEILVEKKNGEEWLLEVEKEYEDDLGIGFGESLMDNYKSCYNKCVFCFIDQNPPGMRDTIYFKDDDTRLSFLQGNYVTLTNMQPKDIERIIEYRLAPINISVHTTNKELRCRMLNNRFAGRVIDYIEMLYKAEIPMNAQIVLCKGYNDGKELEKTISDLMQYAPMMESLSVVPVGLSKYREGLCELSSFTAEDSLEVINIVEKYQKLAMEKFGSHFVHASDEWYINAGLELPEEESYDGYLQLENGVGMTRLLCNEVNQCVQDYLGKRRGEPDMRHIRISGISGVLVNEIMLEIVENIKQAFPRLEFPVYPIKNNFFGEKITVTGLLTGRDILEQLQGKDLGDALILPGNVLKADEDIFLDDMSLEKFQNTLQVPVIIVQSSGMDLFNTISEMESKDE